MVGEGGLRIRAFFRKRLSTSKLATRRGISFNVATWWALLFNDFRSEILAPRLSGLLN